ELGSLTNKNTYTLVDRPPGANVIGTRWVLSKKFDADSHLVKHNKARLVAQGYSQRYGVDFTQTYSPVNHAPAFCLLLAISANKGYAVDSLDISTAFLNGDIDGDVYVRQPPGFIDPQHPNKVWKLNKALYGLKQSPRLCASIYLKLSSSNTLSPSSGLTTCLPAKLPWIIPLISPLLLVSKLNSLMLIDTGLWLAHWLGLRTGAGLK
ncbi:unnamed protein product, partial [Heterosigma akashiwo]